MVRRTGFRRLARETPEAARQMILAAVDAAHGNREVAAQALGISRRQLFRRIARLDLWEAVDDLCRKRGYSSLPGYPRGPAVK